MNIRNHVLNLQSKFDLPKEYFEDPTEAFDRLAEFSQNPKTNQFKK